MHGAMHISTCLNTHKSIVNICTYVFMRNTRVKKVYKNSKAEYVK